MSSINATTSGQLVPKLEADNIYLMDGIAGLLALPSGSVDMLLTDPPYGTTRNFWDTPLPLPEFWAAVKHAVKPSGAILMFSQCPYDKILGVSNLAMLRYEWIWQKDRITGFFNARRMPLKKTENILVFYQKLPTYNPQFWYGKPYSRKKDTHTSENYGRWIITGNGSPDGKRFPCNIIQFNAVQGGIHPTQKPVDLCEYLIKTYTNEGELVVDICAGSGTTAAACISTGRRFICFENAPQYYALAIERIQQERERT